MPKVIGRIGKWWIVHQKDYYYATLPCSSNNKFTDEVFYAVFPLLYRCSSLEELLELFKRSPSR